MYIIRMNVPSARTALYSTVLTCISQSGPSKGRIRQSESNWPSGWMDSTDVPSVPRPSVIYIKRIKKPHKYYRFRLYKKEYKMQVTELNKKI